MAIRLGFGYEQAWPGIFLYEDTTGSVIASEDDGIDNTLARELRDAIVMKDFNEAEQFRDSRVYIRQRDGVKVNRHGIEIDPDIALKSHSPLSKDEATEVARIEKEFL